LPPFPMLLGVGGDTGEVWAVGSPAALYRSSDGGASWSAVERPAPAIVQGVWCDARAGVVAVGGRGGGVRRGGGRAPLSPAGSPLPPQVPPPGARADIAPPLSTPIETA